MKVDVIHISKLEQIEPNDPKKLEVYVTNTLCIDSLYDGWFVNAEVTMGSHDEKDLSAQGYNEIPLSEPRTVKCLFPLYMITVSPSKIFTGKNDRHPETI